MKHHHLPLRAFVLATALLALVPAARGRAQAPAGPDVRVSTTTLVAGQAYPAIAIESNGGAVVTWRSDSLSVRARRLDTAGMPRGGELAVNLVPGGGFDLRPAVAAHPSGGFVVAWQAPDADRDGVWARRFDAGGLPVGGDILISPSPVGRQSGPRIAASPAGYVVVYTTDGTVFARLFDAAMNPSTGAAPIGTGFEADVAVRPDGWSMVTWTQQRGGSAQDVKVRFVNPAGTPVGVEVVANSSDPPGFPTYLSRPRPRVGVQPDASFVVTWHVNQTYLLGSLLPLYVYRDIGSYSRRFTGAGAPIGSQIKLNTFDPGWQYEPTIAVTSSGGYVVGWMSAPIDSHMDPPSPPPQDGSGAGVYARLFDAGGNDIGGGEFQLHATPAGNQFNPALAATAGGFVAAFESVDASGVGVFARLFGTALTPAAFEVDPTDEPQSDGNRVFENGETVVVAPAWRNATGAAAQSVTSTAMGFGGLAGPTYSIVDASADYGVLPDGATRSCRDTGNCFLFSVTGTRPATHWDTWFTEYASPATLFAPRARTLHIGDSFVDVPRSSPYYRFVETVFHHTVITRCGTASFCPYFGVTRDFMAFHVVRAALPALVPPNCVAGAERFPDVPASNPYCPYVEELARRGVVGGCGGGLYCPSQGVSRETMAVYLLLTREGTGYVPPACTAPPFTDVPVSSPFCRWIAELARRGIVGGCGGGAYCPGFGVTREQMSVFLTGTFGLLLYAP